MTTHENFLAKKEIAPKEASPKRSLINRASYNIEAKYFYADLIDETGEP